MKVINYTLANGLTRWDHSMLTDELTNRRPDVNWQEHELGEKEERLYFNSSCTDAQPGALRGHVETLMKEFGGCGRGGETK